MADLHDKESINYYSRQIGQKYLVSFPIKSKWLWTIQSWHTKEAFTGCRDKQLANKIQYIFSLCLLKEGKVTYLVMEFQSPPDSSFSSARSSRCCFPGCLPTRTLTTCERKLLIIISTSSEPTGVSVPSWLQTRVLFLRENFYYENLQKSKPWIKQDRWS